MNAEIVLGIFLFIGFSAPVLTALAKLLYVKSALESSIKESHGKLSERITELAHRMDMLEVKGEHLLDQQTLALKGIEEVAQHVRTRSQKAEDDLDRRLTDTECFLEKTTNFVCRRART